MLDDGSLVTYKSNYGSLPSQGASPYELSLEGGISFQEIPEEKAEEDDEMQTVSDNNQSDDDRSLEEPLRKFQMNAKYDEAKSSEDRHCPFDEEKTETDAPSLFKLWIAPVAHNQKSNWAPSRTENGTVRQEGKGKPLDQGEHTDMNSLSLSDFSCVRGSSENMQKSSNIARPDTTKPDNCRYEGQDGVGDIVEHGENGEFDVISVLNDFFTASDRSTSKEESLDGVLGEKKKHRKKPKSEPIEFLEIQLMSDRLANHIDSSQNLSKEPDLTPGKPKVFAKLNFKLRLPRRPRFLRLFSRKARQEKNVSVESVTAFDDEEQHQEESYSVASYGQAPTLTIEKIVETSPI
jgi:hypothetical protein